MSIIDCIKSGIFFLDGGTGSMLQRRGLKPGELPETWNAINPREIVGLHKMYYEAGSHAVVTNTFGANGLKFDGKSGNFSVDRIVKAAVACAKEAREVVCNGQRERFVALDIGPLGRLLSPAGELPFERAVELFSEVVCAGRDAGADLVFIETMSDCYETKAAVLAAKENCNLPIFVSNVYGMNGKTLSGTTPEAMIAMLEALGVDALGINCSLGPSQMLELLPKFINFSSLPVIVKPNAGLPHSKNGEAIYDISADVFAKVMRRIAEGGASIIGGCCGTTPEYISALVRETKAVRKIMPEIKKHTVVSSYAKAVCFTERPVLIGECINPTGRIKLKEALRNDDIEYVVKESLRQKTYGVHIVDVNVGLPGLDEASVLEKCVREIQSVCNLPLQLDTSNVSAMEKAMRIYNGKPLINSVNGSKESMAAIFPLVKKYGGVVICLTLDEGGIPQSALERYAIAKRILQEACAFGILPQDLIFDPLAMTISSEAKAAMVVLDTLKLIRQNLNCACSLGISNISFGLPHRENVNASFFTMALAQGLNAAIINPYSPKMRDAYHSFMALSGLDENCKEYIQYSKEEGEEHGIAKKAETQETRDLPNGLFSAIISGLPKESVLAARTELEEKHTSPFTLINEQIIPALDAVGRDFENDAIFLPQLLMSAQAAKAAFEAIKEFIPSSKKRGPSVVLATVKGDIHDIGKNIVRTLLENYGYDVIDLGRDVAPDVIVKTVLLHKVKLLGLSALMTTTVPAIHETIRLLREKKLDCRVVVGGAVLTAEYAKETGADFYAKNAMDTVRYAQEILS
ncbi:MAG: homocysteine methyltransferase [Clostridia bacterium]|nr:homocysteine methyltransferase [Clostridia bacterium]